MCTFYSFSLTGSLVKLLDSLKNKPIITKFLYLKGLAEKIAVRHPYLYYRISSIIQQIIKSRPYRSLWLRFIVLQYEDISEFETII